MPGPLPAFTLVPGPGLSGTSAPLSNRRGCVLPEPGIGHWLSKWPSDTCGPAAALTQNPSRQDGGVQRWCRCPGWAEVPRTDPALSGQQLPRLIRGTPWLRARPGAPHPWGCHLALCQQPLASPRAHRVPSGSAVAGALLLGLRGHRSVPSPTPDPGGPSGAALTIHIWRKTVTNTRSGWASQVCPRAQAPLFPSSERRVGGGGLL